MFRASGEGVEVADPLGVVVGDGEGEGLFPALNCQAATAAIAIIAITIAASIFFCISNILSCFLCISKQLIYKINSIKRFGDLTGKPAD
jgi:hypothetical protein